MRYALIDHGVVTNIISLSASNASDFPGAVTCADRPVGIGDTYTDGRFYRDGEPVLTVAERLAAAEATVADLAEYAAELEYQTALNELGMEV